MDTQIRQPVFTLYRQCLLTLLCSFLMVADLPASNKNILISELYENTQLDRQLNWVLYNMKLDQRIYKLPTDVVDTVNQVVKVRYSQELFKSSMAATLEEALSVNELLTLLDWYSSELGQKILHLEIAANDPRNTQHMQTYFEEKLSHELPRNHRILLIESLMEALDAIELGTELTASASVGARRILHEVMPTQDGQALRSPEIMKSREKPAIRREMSNHMRNVYLYTYRSLPDNEIRAYLEFARSSAMQNFQRGQIQAIARIL